jgi:cobalt-zinc-cadmium efflux system outer membrane protein
MFFSFIKKIIFLRFMLVEIYGYAALMCGKAVPFRESLLKDFVATPQQRHSRKISKSKHYGKSETFRTSGGKAAKTVAQSKIFKLTQIVILFCYICTSLLAQTQAMNEPKLLVRYVDQTNGMTADEAVAFALANNGELIALRKELEAAQAMVKQARARANPSLEINGARQIGGKDNNVMVQGSLPLELGGRRSTRILIAEREVTVREKAIADRERILSAEVRAKFGEALAQTLKLKLTDELLDAAQRGFQLVKARVDEGKTAPLEQNMTLVEVNRLRSMREGDAGKVEVAMLELRNMLGMKPEEPLRLRGDFNNLIEPLPSIAEETIRALQTRPDLQAMRAMEELAEAQIKQARAEGRFDASLTAGYQRMNNSFPVSGVDDTGQLRPVQDVFHYWTFGVMIQLPVRNRNQGAIEAATANAEAAKQRREFAELTVRREVASAFVSYERAARAMEIFRVGVREQAFANLDVVRLTYEYGARTLIDYLVEQRRYIELENSFIDSQLEVYLARVEMMRATATTEFIKK